MTINQKDVDRLIPDLIKRIQSDPDRWHRVTGDDMVAAAAKLEEMGIAEMENITRLRGYHCGMIHFLGKTEEHGL